MQFFDKSPFPKHSVAIVRDAAVCRDWCFEVSKAQEADTDGQTGKESDEWTDIQWSNERYDHRCSQADFQQQNDKHKNTEKKWKITAKTERKPKANNNRSYAETVVRKLVPTYSFTFLLFHFTIFFLESSAFRSSLFVFSSFFCIFVPLTTAIRFQRFGVPYAPVLYQIHKHFFLPPFHNYLTF